MHRLLTPQGTLLSFDDAERSSGYNDRMTDVSDGESLSITTASNNSILQKGGLVNSDFVG